MGKKGKKSIRLERASGNAISTKTLYLTRHLHPIAVATHAPGDVHYAPGRGECRLLTEKRLCLAAERVGNDSDAILGLLRAIEREAENERYAGRDVKDWYGLVGIEKQTDSMEHGVCSRCGAGHWFNMAAMPELQNLCFDCWFGPGFVPQATTSGGFL